jgi:hypothetical protein
MAGIKPNNFPLSPPTGTTELYTQTNGINGKFSIEDMWNMMTLFTDEFGYNYGTKFKTFDSDYYEFPFTTTVEAPGVYYKDPVSGTYYEDFAFNSNVPAFGGDGSTFFPAYIKSIFDGTYYLNIVMAVGSIEMRVEDLASDNSQISIAYDNIFFNTSVGSINTSISLDAVSSGISFEDNISGQTSILSLSATEASLKANDLTAQTEIGIDIQDTAGVKSVSMNANNIAQTYTAGFNIYADPTDATQPVRLNISGLKTYVDLAAAQADGLLSGDLFIVGNILNIVP